MADDTADDRPWGCYADLVMRVAVLLLVPLLLVLGCWTGGVFERMQTDDARINAPAVAPGAIAEAPMPLPADDDGDTDPQPPVEGAPASVVCGPTAETRYVLAEWPALPMPESHLTDLPVRPPIA